MLTGSSRDIELTRPVTGEEGHDFEAVVGWRAWVAAPVGGAWRLWSATRSLSWPVRRPTVAACEQCASPPGAACGCGIHALREPEAAMRAAAPSDGALGWNALAAVLGRVVLFGHVREHEGGWRAERAYPAHLYVVAVPGREAMAADAAASLGDYEVPVEVLARAADVAVPAARAG